MLLSFPISFCVSYDFRSTLSRLKVSRTHLLEAVRFRALERRKKGKEKAVRTEETGAQQSHLLRLYAVLQYAQRISAALRAWPSLKRRLQKKRERQSRRECVFVIMSGRRWIHKKKKRERTRCNEHGPSSDSDGRGEKGRRQRQERQTSYTREYVNTKMPESSYTPKCAHGNRGPVSRVA